MANLDKFLQPLYGETYFQEATKICECAHCETDLFVGDDCFEAADLVFCDLECFTEWAIAEHSGQYGTVEEKQ